MVYTSSLWKKIDLASRGRFRLLMRHGIYDMNTQKQGLWESRVGFIDSIRMILHRSSWLKWCREKNTSLVEAPGTVIVKVAVRC